MSPTETEQTFAGGKAVKVEPASDGLFFNLEFFDLLNSSVADPEPIYQLEVKMEVPEELNENLATPQLEKKKPKRLPQRKRMQLKKAKAMEANKIGEDKNCDATATSKLDVSAQPPKKKHMNSSENEQIGAGSGAVKVEPASDVVDVEPRRQVKMEVAEELNESLTNPKRLSKSVRIARKKQKAALALLGLIQANEGNKVGEDKACESTSGTKVNASTQTEEKRKEKRYKGKRISHTERKRRKLRRAQGLNFKQMVKKTLNAEIKQLTMINSTENEQMDVLVQEEETIVVQEEMNEEASQEG
uniref:BZIP domain-containing protein n=1 Tax=Meloidogyne floridensis TaxID=298350 RepID=A0A915PGY8_9BILA